MRTTPVADSSRPTLPKSRRKKVPVFAAKGAWAITPYLDYWDGVSRFSNTRWFSVTHVPSGCRAGGTPLELSKAKRLLEAFDALPDKVAWRQATSRSKITKRMLAASKAIFMTVTKRTEPTEDAGKEQP